jgi:hypothetical protein
MTIETGALEQAYAIVEGSYAVVPADALSATDGIRHLQLALSGKNNREASPEKRGTPDRRQSLPRRKTANFNLSEIMWEPSGTLGTVSNVAKFLKAGFGSIHTLSLTTDINDAASTATDFDLTSVTGLAVGDLIAVEMSAGVFEVTRITAIAGSNVTVDELSAAPPDNAVVLCGSTFKLANNITESLAVYKYHNAGDFKQAVYGAVVDQIQVNFDGTREVMLAIQGPAAAYGDTAGGYTVQAKPASHTTVGSPVGGMVGGFYVNGAAFKVISARATINNQIALRNKELGTSVASGIGGRNNLRDVTVECTFYLEDTTLLGLAHTVAAGQLRCLVGNSTGDMVAMVVPNVEFEVPDIGGDIGLKEVTISGVAYAVSGNDQIYLAEL